MAPNRKQMTGMDKRALSERDICTKFITPALRRAGWDEMLQIREEVSFTKGRIIVRGKLVSRGQAKRADYVLYFKPNIPLALIEAKDIELTRFAYQANTWSKPRWVVGIRQHIERRAAPKGKTLNLFADDPVIGKWRFSALVTDLDLPAEAIWRIYRGRADCENRIKELKYDFAADSFNMKDFWATEATLNTVLLAYNLMSLLRQVLLKTSAVKHSSTSVQHTLQTLRYKLFAKAAYITTESRKPILNLALAMQQRAWMQGLWDASKTFDLPATFTPIYSL